MTKRILIFIRLASQFVELSRVARLLRESGRYEPLFCFQQAYPTLQKDVEVCQSENWKYLVSVPSAPTRQRVEAIKRPVKALPMALRLELKSLKYFISSYCGSRKLIKALISQIHKIFKEYRPSLMIFAMESVSDSNYIVIRIGQQYGIPSVIVPFTFADTKEAAEHFCGKAGFDANANLTHKLISRLFPHYVYEYRGRKLFRLKAADIVAREISGFRYSHPWVNNSEESSIIAVESERMLKYYKKQGLSENRLVVTGALTDDPLAEGLKTGGAGLYQEYELDTNKPLLLCALPPNQLPRECEFKEFDDLLRFWMQSFASIQGWNILIRPHPRLTKTEIETLHQFGFTVTLKDTVTLVPKCDLYVASVSATIRWAIACGKPVVNYDVYRYNYQDYSNMSGVLTLNNKKDFVGALKRLTEDRVYYDQVADAQKEASSYWARLDGNSSKRMLELFENLISGSKGKG